jgi:hypothetical protein
MGMAKVLAVTYDVRLLFDVNNLPRALGHDVRGADCPFSLRRRLATAGLSFLQFPGGK